MRISDWSSDVCSSDLLYVDQPRTDVVLRNILRGEIDLGARLQDQALGNALVVIALDPAQNIALGREEQRAFDLEHAGSQALDADRRVSAVGPAAEVLADTALKIEIGVDGPAIEHLHLRAVDAAAELAFALALEPEPVAIAAVKAFAIPAIAIATAMRLILEQVEQHLPEIVAAAVLHHDFA